MILTLLKNTFEKLLLKNSWSRFKSKLTSLHLRLLMKMELLMRDGIFKIVSAKFRYNLNFKISKYRMQSFKVLFNLQGHHLFLKSMIKTRKKTHKELVMKRLKINSKNSLLKTLSLINQKVKMRKQKVVKVVKGIQNKDERRMHLKKERTWFW